VKGKQGRRLKYNRGTEKTSRTDQERHPAGKDAVPRRQSGRSVSGAIQDQELVFEQKGLGNEGTDAARLEQLGQDDD
jgi:hypothetical protein